MMVLLVCVLLLAGVMARVALVRAGQASAVDQYYWILAAKAYREQRTLPVRLHGKYLMEDDTQSYPPLFGTLLGRMPPGMDGRLLMLVLELGQLLVLGLIVAAYGGGTMALLLALAAYVAAPILVVYNAQLTPRVLGDFFLSFAMLCQLAAVFLVQAPWAEGVLWGLSALLLVLVIMTHKMTLQLHLVLLPFWAWALDTWFVPLASLAGFCLFVAMVGGKFAAYQFRAHWDIVRFWQRHWPTLGAHQFAHSPLYGDPDKNRGALFHAPGWRGWVKHLRVVLSYAPLNGILPLYSLATQSWPPTWLMVWFFGTYLWVAATLFVPWLKCLGGGHLYVFNAIVPGALYLAGLASRGAAVGWVALGVALTLFSLWMALRVVANRPTARNADFDQVLEQLRALPPGRVAVFPLQSAEAVAARTEHSVLWGGHGYGFRNLEGFFPVLTRPLSGYLADHRVNWLLWDSVFWPEGEAKLAQDGLIAAPEVREIGRWRLAPVPLDNIALPDPGTANA